MASDDAALLEGLVTEQKRANQLLERIADRPAAPTKKRWLCPTGRLGTCWGPWWVCALTGCQGPNGGS
jgi:hypothetical protein